MSENKEKRDYPVPTLVKLPIKDIMVPDVRVTSVMPDEIRELFASSIRASGVINPIQVIWDGKNYILVDGLHRLMEARNNNQYEIDAIVMNGSLKDVMIKNLQTGRLQGRGKVTDVIRVIKYLIEEEKMSIDEVARYTGYPIRRIEDLLTIANADPEILNYLDREEISLGAALEIARIPDRDAQLQVLYYAAMYRMTVKDVKELVERTLIALKTKERKALEEAEKPAREEVLIKCFICEDQYPAKEMRSIIVCPVCMASIMDVKVRLQRERERELGNLPSIAPGGGEGGLVEETNENNSESKDEQPNE
jgi:ParB-like chromosome segregation protein Spo0J